MESYQNGSEDILRDSKVNFGPRVYRVIFNALLDVCGKTIFQEMEESDKIVADNLTVWFLSVIFDMDFMQGDDMVILAHITRTR